MYHMTHKSDILHLSYRVPATLPLYDILNEFQKGHSHMAVVVRQRNKIVGDSAGKPAESRHQLHSKYFLIFFLFSLFYNIYWFSFLFPSLNRFSERRKS